MLIPKDPKRISKSFDDDNENDDEDDVLELERKIRYHMSNYTILCTFYMYEYLWLNCC